MAMKFGSILRAVRERAGFNQEEFADHMNMSQSCVSKIENDRKIPDALTFVEWFKQTNSQDVAVSFFFGMDAVTTMTQIISQLPMFAYFHTFIAII